MRRHESSTVARSHAALDGPEDGRCRERDGAVARDSRDHSHDEATVDVVRVENCGRVELKINEVVQKNVEKSTSGDEKKKKSFPLSLLLSQKKKSFPLSLPLLLLTRRRVPRVPAGVSENTRIDLRRGGCVDKPVDDGELNGMRFFWGGVGRKGEEFGFGSVRWSRWINHVHTGGRVYVGLPVRRSGSGGGGGAW